MRQLFDISDHRRLRDDRTFWDGEAYLSAQRSGDFDGDLFDLDFGY